MNTKRLRLVTFIMTGLALAPTLLADGISVTWFTVDGGGGYIAGGGYVLKGTIGQHDAGPASGPMAGNGIEIRGGFWPASSGCICPGDMNGDGTKNGVDIQQFVLCLITDSGCSCADVDAFKGVTIDDAAVFVSDLLAGDGCP